MEIIKPVFRIFDYNKTIEFYIDWLGFKIDWQNKQDAFPVYMQISFSNIVLHLSEHHGDGSPGGRVFIDDFKNLKEYHQKLVDKKYKYNRPSIEEFYYDKNALEMQVYDPFNNRLIFVERNAI